MNTFKQLPLSELRTNLPKFKRQVQLGLKRIAVSYSGQVIGFLVPLKDISKLEEEGLINDSNSSELSLSDFRAQIMECGKKIQSDIDCIYLTFSTRRAAAFVSSRFSSYLSLPSASIDR